MRKNCFSKKKFNTPPPPPEIFFAPNFFWMLEMAWNAKTWNLKKKIQYLKNSSKIQTTFHQYQKLYSTPPWLGAHTCKVLRKCSNAFLSYSAKTKRDGRIDGRGALQYLPSPGLRRRREIGATIFSRYHHPRSKFMPNTAADGVAVGFIKCLTTTFLHTHHSLLAKLGWWGWSPGVWVKDLIPNFAIIGNGQGRHSLGGDEIQTEAHLQPRDGLLYWDPSQELFLDAL